MDLGSAELCYSGRCLDPSEAFRAVISIGTPEPWFSVEPCGMQSLPYTSALIYHPLPPHMPSLARLLPFPAEV